MTGRRIVLLLGLAGLAACQIGGGTGAQSAVSGPSTIADHVASVAADAPLCRRAAEPSGPCAAKVGFPAGFPEKRLHGMIIIVAGGGWQSTVPATPVTFTQQYYRKAFDRWVGRGYVVAMVEHSDGTDVVPGTATGSSGFDNVVAWYDHYRAFWTAEPGYGRDFPICATGFSSGGHFALLLGAARPSLDCVVAEGPPTQIDYAAPATHAPGFRADVQALADRTFSGVAGVSPSRVWSPLYQKDSLGRLRMPILIGQANNDPLVLARQTHAFCPRDGLPTCRAEYLEADSGPAADTDFTHANVRDQDLLDFRAKERAWVCQIASKVTGPCS